MSQTQSLLSLQNLSRQINSNGKDRSIVDQVSFEFERGRIYNILGPSGSGKSSLLRLINRLDEATSGDVLFHGTNITDLDPCQLRRQIGYLFQVPHLFEGTVRDNVRHTCPDITADRVNQLAERIQIEPSILDNPVDNLSEGEKQRVAIARLLATNPEVILLDEPTSALDPARTETIEKLVCKIVSEDGITTLMVTHNPEQAVRMGGETLLLVDGCLVEYGSSSDVVNNPQTEQGRRYREKKLS